MFNVRLVTLALAASVFCISQPAQAQQAGTYAFTQAGIDYIGFNNDGSRTLTPATSAFSSVSSDRVEGTGAANGSASLADASLHGFATSTAGGSARSDSSWSDTLTLDLGPDADPNGSTLLTFLYTFEGDLAYDAGGAGMGTAEFLVGAFGAPIAGFTMTLNRNGGQAETFSVSNSGNMLSLDSAQFDDDTWLIQGTWAMPNYDASSLFLSSRLQVLSAGNATADFSNTASLQLLLPPGVTYSSASGQFLTAATSSVPEPSTWGMMLLGFGAIGLAMRKSRGAMQLA